MKGSAQAAEQSATIGGARAAAIMAVGAMPAAAWALGRLAWSLVSAAGEPGAGVDAYVAPAVIGVGAAVCAYLAAVSLVMLGASLTGALPRWTAAVAPRAWRRVVATAAGVTLSAGLAAPALAADPVPGWAAQVVGAAADTAPGWAPASADVFAPELTATDSAPGWLDVPHAADTGTLPRAEQTETSTPQTAADLTLTVSAGDSLWDLTASLLGDDDATLIASEWPLLYAENRDEIGDDPGLILPGQVLRVPAELAR